MKSTTEEVSFEWLHHKISSADSNYIYLQNYIYLLTLGVKGWRDMIHCVSRFSESDSSTFSLYFLWYYLLWWTTQF